MSNNKEYMRVYMTQRYHKRRADAIAILGGMCAECGSNKDLQIDHKDPDTKAFDLGKALSGWAWHRILAELDKCQLLCNNHHRGKTRKDLAKKFSQREHWEHGTLGGYRYCKPVCDPCRLVHNAYWREYKRNKRLAPVI